MKISIKRVQNDACISAAEREKFGTQFKKYMFMAVAGMLALSSCSSDDNDVQDVQNAPRQMTFTAGYNDDGTTRATLDGSTKKVSFDAGDKIGIISTNNPNVQFTTSAGGASATFTGTATDDAKFYAVYPYTEGLTLVGNVIKVILIPTNQWNSNWESDEVEYSGWDPKAPVAYATTTGSSLQFHNLCAILKLTFPSVDTFGWFTISANEPLAGAFDLDTSTGTLTPNPGSNTVAVGAIWDKEICTDYVGKTVYVAIAPGTYTGFNLHLYNEDDDDKTILKSGSVTFEAGKIYDLRTFRFDNLG